MRLDDLPAARAIAEQLSTSRVGAVRQVDTYFHCNHGRLKLRQADPGRAQLIGYQRDNEAAARPSDYVLVEIADPAALIACLQPVLGVWKVVDKQREIFLHHNVRIHLDQVRGLGDFLELEAVLDERHDQTACRRQVEQLLESFGISASDLLSTSYSDMA